MNAKIIGVSALAGLLIAGCGKQEAADEMAVSVNGVKLMQSAIDADVNAVIAMQGDKIPTNQLEYAKTSIANQIVQGFIFKTVLIEKATKAGFTVTEADRKERMEEMLKRMKDVPDAPKTAEEVFAKFPFGIERAKEEFDCGILIDKLVKDAQAKAPAKDYSAEAKKIIDNVISNNVAAKASETNALSKIKALKAQLDKVPAANLTNEFAKLAKENSACPSSAKGGDLGEFTHGQMVKEFDEVAFKLPLFKVSEPVKTQFGYHLVMVTKKIPAVAANGDKPAAPEKVQASHILLKGGAVRDVPKEEDVVKYLKMQGEREFMSNFVQEAIKTAKLEASEKYKEFLPQEEPEAPELPIETSEEK